MVIVIVLTVSLSATTTFMTVRQSAKRGLMQTNVDPNNPMAQSQKFMQYIVPFFSLTGLYWQYGLVLYWVTTNLWTLGQQYFMFRNWDPQPVGAEGALGGATTGGPVKTAQNSSRTGSARPVIAAGFGTPGIGCRQDGRQRRADRHRARGHGERAAGRAGVGFGPGQGRHDVCFGPDGDDRDGVPPGDHRVPPGHRPERHGKARAAETGPGESRTRAPGRRAHR